MPSAVSRRRPAGGRALAKGEAITADELPPALKGPRASERSESSLIPGATLWEIERQAILRTLYMVGGSTAKASEVLGISVRKIQYRLKEYAAEDAGEKRAPSDDEV